MSAKAFRLSPSQQWSGNDGQWSTFALQVGNPVTTVFVLPATSKRETWVVNPLGCQAPDASNCNATRGELFDPNLSSSWRNLSNDPQDQYRSLDFGSEAALDPLQPAQLNYSGGALLGTDTLGFGFVGENNGQSLQGQVFASYAVPVPYVGILGLSPANSTILSLSDPYFSVLGALRNTSAIPSLYWGYTAGAVYRNTFASLVLGGFDASRGNVNNIVTIPLALQTDRQLVLTLRSTTLNVDSRSQQVDMPPISIFIDSLVPEIWLPSAAYTAFENAFGLVWNSTYSLYLVNDSQHDLLTRENAAVTFSLAADSTNTTTTNITLPYAAFNLTAQYPLLGVNNTSANQRYFPLKRAQSADQYYLGRTFLQEAYVAVDYDNNVFHISPAVFSGAAEDIRTVDASSSSSHKHTGLSGGAIAGIVIGALAVLAILGAPIWWFFFRNRKGKRSRKSKSQSYGTGSIGGTTIEAWQEGIPPGHVEHYKPAMSEIGSSDQDNVKQELDARETARGPTVFHRHELSAGTIRRISDQSRASISPLEERNRKSHYRSGSFGVPSPRSASQMGVPSPPLDSGNPSPPLGDPNAWFGGPVELHGFSRGSPMSPSTPAVEEEPAIQEEAANADRSKLTRLEGTNR